ncbi:hypothetical protein PX52LOC_03902 [Limnoglobus roseus]|uniref:Uncharacterized protein n=2 Tax=Limnoglobus roseus TaxID=2598579 RepID=A0A5C1AG18_9BACT|nr:hypothetical protein PX52LOC_03902 [Limnoglobus roseus]
MVLRDALATLSANRLRISAEDIVFIDAAMRCLPYPDHEETTPDEGLTLYLVVRQFAAMLPDGRPPDLRTLPGEILPLVVRRSHTAEPSPSDGGRA